MTLVNTSGLSPSGAAVLVIPYEPEFAKSLIFIPPTASERSRMIEDRAIVLEIGSEAWADESRPRAAVGDKVLIGKLCGNIVNGPADGKKYRIVNAGDIYCTITQEKAS